MCTLSTDLMDSGMEFQMTGPAILDLSGQSS